MTAAELDRHRYVSLATFRRDGAEVATPVWFADVGDKLYVVSAGDVRQGQAAPAFVTRARGAVRRERRSFAGRGRTRPPS